jgi:leucine dehydrogenase
MSNDFDFFAYAMEQKFGDVHFKVDPKTGLKAIIAIHNTNLGPSLGGCRFKIYNHYQEAIYDAMRLARGMSLKSALADLPLGGGKAVIMEPTTPYNRIELLKSFGKFINELRGRYITAVDVGTNVADMDVINQSTLYVTCTSAYEGNGPSNPAALTALGVQQGIKAALQFRFGSPELANRHIAIQGVGSVGYLLAEMLSREGAKLTVCDMNQQAVNQCVERFGATACSLDEVMRLKCDVLAPCALGAVLNQETIPHIQAPIVAGAANNQLATVEDGARLAEHGIIYAPDYVINAGGIIHVAYQYQGKNYERIIEKVNGIYHTTLNILNKAKAQNKPTSEVAEQIALEKLCIEEGVHS